MKVSRLSATAAVLLLAGLTLTACGPDEVAAPAAPSAPSASAAAPSTPAAKPSDSGTPSAAKPSPSAKPSSAKPSGTPAGSAKPTGPIPTANCTAAAAGIGQVLAATDVSRTAPGSLKAQGTKFVCGPDVPDDGYFEGFGDAKTYTFASGAKASVLAGVQPKAVPLDAFLQHADDCLHQRDTVQAPYGCFGNMYVVTTNSAGAITSITELYHP